MTAKIIILFFILAIQLRAEVPEIDAETRARFGIITEELTPAELAPTIAATAIVLDPSPLVALLRQRESASETMSFSKKNFEREEKLFTEGNLVSQKIVDAARAQFLADKAAYQAILDSIFVNYGSSSSFIENPDDLLKSVKILVSFSTRSTPEKEPISATLGGFTTSSLTRAPSADPVFQNLSWLSIIDAKKFVPGMIIPATLTLPGELQKGHLLPSSAIVWHLGHAWVFRETEAARFVRIPAQITTSIPGGYLITDAKFPTKAIVTTGAQLLLSTEISTPEE